MRQLHLSTRVLAAIAFAACATESTAPVAVADHVVLDKKGGGGGGGGGPSRTVYNVTVDGDFILPVGFDPAPQVTRSSKDPFGGSEITLDDVRLEIGPAPSGDPAVCAIQFPNVTLASHWNGNEGVWTGTVAISESYLNLSGSRIVNGATELVQSSANSQGQYSTTRNEGAVWYLEFTNALQYFGGNGATTHYDGLYRCVTFRVILTPA